MSNLKTWLYKRRGKVFEGETLQQAVDYFLKLVEDGAEVYEFPDAIIVLENYGLPGNVRGYLLFDNITNFFGTYLHNSSCGRADVRTCGRADVPTCLR